MALFFSAGAVPGSPVSVAQELALRLLILKSPYQTELELRYVLLSTVSRTSAREIDKLRETSLLTCENPRMVECCSFGKSFCTLCRSSLQRLHVSQQ